MAAAQIPRGPARATHNELTVSAEARTSTRKRTGLHEAFSEHTTGARVARCHGSTRYTASGTAGVGGKGR